MELRFLHAVISSRWLVHFSDSRDELAFYFASMHMCCLLRDGNDWYAETEMACSNWLFMLCSQLIAPVCMTIARPWEGQFI